MEEQTKMLELTQQRYNGSSGANLRKFMKYANFRGKHPVYGDKSDIDYLKRLRYAAKLNMNTEDFNYFLVAYGKSYRKALRFWARSAIQRKKAVNGWPNFLYCAGNNPRANMRGNLLD